MSYFSRLTDIVTCNLTELLRQADDPRAAIGQIVAEMEEGLSGAKRSVATATANEERLYREIQGHRDQAQGWAAKAKELLKAGLEREARQTLIRKREVEDLIGGLQQQHQAAVATREHLSTMQRALEARLAEALRKRAALEAGGSLDHPEPPIAAATVSPEDERMSQIDAEMEALRRELETN